MYDEISQQTTGNNVNKLNKKKKFPIHIFRV